jgi:hypothetical protein
MSVVLTEEYNVLVNKEELIGTAEYMDEVSHKPKSLYSVSTVLEGKFVLLARAPNNLYCWHPFIINVNLTFKNRASYI